MEKNKEPISISISCLLTQVHDIVDVISIGKGLEKLESIFVDKENNFEIQEIDSIKKYGIVYILVGGNKIYVGKSKGEYFRTRLNAHIKGGGKGTSKRFDDFKDQEKTIYYLKTIPVSLRNILEEELINEFKNRKIELLNYKTINKTTP